MQQQQQGDENWLPLESNPEVINALLLKMGLKVQEFSFQEMLSTEQWALEMIPQPVLGVLFLYEETPVQEAFKKNEEQHLKPEEALPNVFYMKQFAKNACGTIALFHIIINATEQYPGLVNENSFLDKFKTEGGSLDPKKRGQLFKSSKDILTEHKEAVAGGQSQVQTDCNSHFIAFICKNGRIYELDGCKKCPVDHGACTEEEFLTKGSLVIKEFMQRDPDNNNFSMIVLAKNQE